MKLPVQITYRNLQSSPAIEARIHEEIAKLESFYDGIISCRVAVELPHHKHERGNPFHICIDLSVPGAELVVKQEPTLHGALRKTETPRAKKQAETQAPHKDIYVALRDAFKTARRELQDYVRRQRRQVKQHDEPPRGRVSKLFPASSYGFLEAADGRSVYFHAHSLAEGEFGQLEIGDEVRFAEEPGEEGPQASYVKLLRARKSAKAG